MQLFDFQVNGFSGVDFQSESLSLQELKIAVSALHRHQTKAIFLTIITDSVDAMCRKLENAEALRAKDTSIATTVCGYHLEGPWISTESGYNGAHPLEHARNPSLADYRRLRDAAGGNLKLITLAPELPDSELVMEAASADGVRIGLGHTNASEKDIDKAILCGATLATHLGNAVPQIMDRHDNVVQRLLSRDELIACLIPDGLHLPPFVLKNFFHAKPKNRVFFTTDCMSAAGAPPGTYTIGPHTMEVGTDGIVRLPGDTRFAGSSLTMDKAIKNIENWLEIENAEIVSLCSDIPAQHFGINL